MKTFLTAGFLYLIGVSVILLVKPSTMFMPNGDWKEFGIGRNPATHTWMPVWLFMFLWAMVSYIIALIIENIFFKSVSDTSSNTMNIVDEFHENEYVTQNQRPRTISNIRSNKKNDFIR
jgi:Zn-dependent protease with chaperone function